MARRPFDASRAVCDVCGQLYKPGDDMYTVMSKYDPDVEDRDVLLKFRHYTCQQRRQVEHKTALDKLGDASKAARDALEKLRRMGL